MRIVGTTGFANTALYPAHNVQSSSFNQHRLLGPHQSMIIPTSTDRPLAPRSETSPLSSQLAKRDNSDEWSVPAEVGSVIGGVAGVLALMVAVWLAVGQYNRWKDDDRWRKEQEQRQREKEEKRQNKWYRRHKKWFRSNV